MYKKKICVLSVCVVVAILFLVFFAIDSNETELPGGFVYNSQRKDIIGVFDIPPTIIEYEWCGDYIFIEQIPDMPIDAIYDIGYYNYLYDTKKLYWIIDTKKEVITGPIDSVFYIEYMDSISHITMN
jgi:hypothetical protein